MNDLGQHVDKNHLHFYADDTNMHMQTRLNINSQAVYMFYQPPEGPEFEAGPSMLQQTKLMDDSVLCSPIFSSLHATLSPTSTPTDNPQ